MAALPRAGAHRLQRREIGHEGRGRRRVGLGVVKKREVVAKRVEAWVRLGRVSAATREGLTGSGDAVVNVAEIFAEFRAALSDFGGLFTRVWGSLREGWERVRGIGGSCRENDRNCRRAWECSVGFWESVRGNGDCHRAPPGSSLAHEMALARRRRAPGDAGLPTRLWGEQSSDARKSTPSWGTGSLVAGEAAAGEGVDRAWRVDVSRSWGDHRRIGGTLPPKRGVRPRIEGVDVRVRGEQSRLRGEVKSRSGKPASRSGKPVRTTGKRW
jgi:hypothetical protein